MFYHLCRATVAAKEYLSRDQILDALHIEPLDHVNEERFMKRLKRPKAVPHKEATIFFFRLRSRYLRHFVDSWLATGLRGDGSESPRERDLKGTTFAAFHRHLETSPPKVEFSPISRELSVTLGALPKGPARPTDPFSGAHFDALRFFSAIVLGDSKEWLCKCRHVPCGRYFLLKTPRSTYRYGTFCSREHQRFASALVCTRDRRDKAKGMLIDSAAQQLLRSRILNSDWQRDVRRKDALAEVLRRVIRKDPNLESYRPTLRTNWVTRNQISIEQRRLELAIK